MYNRARKFIAPIWQRPTGGDPGAKAALAPYSYLSAGSGNRRLTFVRETRSFFPLRNTYGDEPRSAIYSYAGNPNFHSVHAGRAARVAANHEAAIQLNRTSRQIYRFSAPNISQSLKRKS
jgi:hypothetical protein